MKKNLLFVGAMVLGTTAIAQSNYTNSDEAAVGTSATLYVVDSNATNYANETGTGATWDYSAIGGYSSETRSISITDATAHAQSSNFPNATHSMSIENFVTTFYSVSATEKTQYGFLYNEPTFGELRAEFDTDQMKTMEYPFALNGSFSDAFEGSMNYTYILPQSDDASGNVHVDYDGNGTLMLEGSTLTDVIRIKTVDTTEFTSAAGPVKFAKIQYEYYHFATSSLPVFVHSSVNISGVADLSFSLVMSSVDPSQTVGINTNEVSLEEFKMYPNPANDQVNLNFGNANGVKADVAIFNAIGQQVMQTKVAANGVQTLDVAHLNKGIYFVKVSNGANKITKKLLIK